MPDPIYIAWADNGHIRKWDRKPFEIDGVRATEFHVAHMAGLHTCSDACDRPACVLRRENAHLTAQLAEAEAEVARLRGALQQAADQFAHYELQHLDKQTAEGNAKADTNARYAAMCRAAYFGHPSTSAARLASHRMISAR